MYYNSQSTKNIPCNHALPETNGTNVWILIILIKEPKILPQFMEDISSQHLTGKYNRIQFITDLRDKKIVRTNIQENISIFNKIRPIQSIENKLILLPKNFQHQIILGV